MKTLIFAFAMLFASLSFADERIFDCSAIRLAKSADIPAELGLTDKPTVLFRQSLKNWSLQVGNTYLDTRDNNGPALALDTKSSNATTVQYVFSVEASTEFELQVSVVTHNAKVYYWGLGERTFLGDFSCEIVEP